MNNIEPTGQNKREQLKELLYLIRMPLLSIEEFTRGPVKSEILSEKECLDVYKSYQVSCQNKFWGFWLGLERESPGYLILQSTLTAKILLNI